MAQKRGRTRLRGWANSPNSPSVPYSRLPRSSETANDMSDSRVGTSRWPEECGQVRVCRFVVDDEAHIDWRRAAGPGASTVLLWPPGCPALHRPSPVDRLQQPGRRHAGNAGPDHRDPLPLRSPHLPRHPCYVNRITICPPGWITAAVSDPIRPAARKGGMYVSRQPWAARAGAGWPRPGRGPTP